MLKLDIEDVGKKYKGDVWGIRHFSLRLETGIFGLLGPNGAGKTTLMNIIATVTKATEGRVLWNGTDVAHSADKLRAVLGYLPQDFGIYPNLNTLEFLRYMAAIKGVEARAARRRIDQLLGLVNLTEVCRRPMGELSGGMKQRAGIAQALLNDPELLIVDEPTVGLDPEERVRFRNLLSELSGERIVVLSTHIVSDIEAAAAEIIVVNRGRMMGHTSAERLLQAVADRTWICVIPSSELAAFRQRYLVSGAIKRSEGVHVRVIHAEPPSASARPISPNLEDAYLYLISSGQNESVLASEGEA